MPRYVALLRGINVGRAKRINMSDLREAVSSLGFEKVRTVLNSGNVLFTSGRPLPSSAADRLEEAVRKTTGVSAKAIVVPRLELMKIIDEDPFEDERLDPRLLLVGITKAEADLKALKPLAKLEWKPDRLVVGTRAVYLWCPRGASDSPMFKAVSKELGERFTTRNWATLQKLAAGEEMT